MVKIPNKLTVISSTGETVGTVKITQKPIGTGAFGNVYQGRLNGKDVAVKIFNSELENKEVSVEEIAKREFANLEAVQGLAHLPILEGRATYQEGGKTHEVIVTDFIHGSELFDKIADPKFTLNQLSDATRQVFLALNKLHSLGVVHRDIKLENLMINQQGQVCLIDVGLSHLKGRRNEIVGTPDYLAPEGFEEGEHTPALDLWAVGATLFNTATQTLFVSQVYSYLTNLSDDTTELQRTLGKTLLGTAGLVNFKKHFMQMRARTREQKAALKISIIYNFMNVLKSNPLVGKDKAEKVMQEILGAVIEKYVKDPNLRDLITQLIRVKPEERVGNFEALESKFLGESQIHMVPMNKPEAEPTKFYSIGERIFILLFNFLNLSMPSNIPRSKE